MNFFRIFFLILFTFFLGGSLHIGLFAQSYNFKNFSAEQGLTSLNVDAIFQDRKGNLWIGGYAGLSKFNGKLFTNYPPEDKLSNPHVTCVAEDNDGNIWAGTVSGLNKFRDGDFSIFTKQSGLAGDNITSIVKDKNGKLWFGTTEGITCYNGKSFTSFTTKNGLISDNIYVLYLSKSGAIYGITDKGISKIITPDNTSLSNYHFENNLFNFHSAVRGSAIASIAEDDIGNTWFGTDSGVVKYDGIKFIRYTTKDGLSCNSVSSIVKSEHSNDIWVGTSDGLNKISADGKIENFKIKHVRNGNDITHLFVDEEGNLWLGTHNGLYRFRDPSFCTFSEQDGLKDSQIEFVFCDHKKNLWFGTAREGAYCCNNLDFLRSGFHSMKNFSEKDGHLGTAAKTCLEDNKGNILIGTDKGVFLYNGKTFVRFHGGKEDFKQDEVTAIMQDNKNRIWFGINKTVKIWSENKVSAYELQSAEPNLVVYSEFQDSKGNIWIGTRSGELFLYDGKNYINFSQKLNLKAKTYFSITEDKGGLLYFGSFSGIYIYDPSRKNIPASRNVYLVNKKDGLSSDMVYAMAFDSAYDNLYIGTNQGLNKLDVKEFKKSGKINLKQYGQEDGLSSLDFNPNGISRSDDGTFWLGTINGLVHFNPVLFYENHVESNTSINKIRLFYKDTILPSNSLLEHDENNISFEYMGICLTNPDKVRYKFKLEGYDNVWSPETKETFARYSNLAPNKYMFKVMSCNNEGLWNKEPASFAFEISPPMHKTWWFRIIISVIAIVLFAVFSKLRADAIRRQEAERLNREIHLANNELKALRAQMDPHFIFNSLSSIQSFIMTKDEDSALRYLNKFAKLMRMILSNSEKALVTIEEEIESLKLYLELEALRWDKKFDYSIIIDREIETDFQKIPSMLMQPYVENAVLHGVVPKKEGKGKIEISITQRDTHLVCAIFDNGVGRKKSQELRQRSNQLKYESMGMKITSDRLEILNRIHHSDLSVKITDMEDGTGNSSGTKVEIFIPLS